MSRPQVDSSLPKGEIMKSIIAVALVFVSQVALSAVNFEACLMSKAKRMDSHNLPNEFIYSNKRDAKLGLADVISKLGYKETYKNKYMGLALEAQAILAVVVFEDETHLVYLGAKIENNRCKVYEIVDINIMDGDFLDTQLTKKNILDFFLQKSKSQLSGSTQEWVFNHISDALSSKP